VVVPRNSYRTHSGLIPGPSQVWKSADAQFLTWDISVITCTVLLHTSCTPEISVIPRRINSCYTVLRREQMTRKKKSVRVLYKQNLFSKTFNPWFSKKKQVYNVISHSKIRWFLFCFILFWWCLGIKSRALCMLGKCSITEPHPQSTRGILKDCWLVLYQELKKKKWP
jgi:hypothetical protein